MTEYATLADDHIETPVLRRFASGARCAVVAAYKGATMKYLLEHGATYVAGVEPQEWAWELACRNLDDSDWTQEHFSLDCCALVPWETAVGSTVPLHNFGTDGARILGVHGWLSPEYVEDVKALNVGEWLEDTGKIDFMVMNCEGGEYMLFPYLAATCKVVLVQFHGPPIRQWDTGYGQRTDIGKGWWLYE